MLLLLGGTGSGAGIVQQDVFISGRAGYHTYRIPAIVTSTNGTLLAFCEGRKEGSGDSGDIDIVFRRSLDSGASWTQAKTIIDFGPDTIGNPAPVVDRETRVIWLLLTRNPGGTGEKEIIQTGAGGTRTVWVTHSEDDGANWAEPTEITRDVKPNDWTWYATGPVNGIQTRSGRLVIPCNHEVKGHAGFYSHIIYSDDHGKTWKLGGSTAELTDESTVAELWDGTLLLNMRSNAGRQRRAVSVSKDGGLHWSAPYFDRTLIEPVCQGSLIRHGGETEGGKAFLLFSNPASERRVRMTIRASGDEGRSWCCSRLVHEGPSAYSCLTVLNDGTVGLLYERGDVDPYEKITFARIRLDWILGRK